MAPTRPRFGGGRIMETAARKNISLPKNMEGETQITSSAEPILHIRSCEPNAQAKDDNDAGKKTTTKAVPDGNEDSLGESESHFEKEEKLFQSKEASLNDLHRCEDHVCRDHKSIKHSFTSPRSLIQNDPDPQNQDLESKEYETGSSTGHGSKAEVKHLLSVLQSLGIHVVLKPYVRSAPSSTKEMDGAAVDGEAKKEMSLQDKPTEMSTETFSVEKKLGSKSSKDERTRQDNNCVYCKNLFLKDRHDHFYFVIAEESAVVDFKVLKKQLNAVRNLSFADATAIENILGEKSGGLSPFVAMREPSHVVRFVLHQSLLEAKHLRTQLAFHPLDSSLQVEITVNELITFLEHFDKRLEILPVDLSSSMVSECLPSHLSQGMIVNDSSSELKKRNVKVKVLSTSNGDSQELKRNEDNNLVNPTVNGKPLWKVHMRKGKLKSFLKAANDKNIISKTDTSQTSDSVVQEFKEKEPEFSNDSSSPNPLITGLIKLDYTFSKLHAHNDKISEESESLNDEIEQPNLHLGSLETVSTSTLPEITQFYRNLSDACIKFQDLDMCMSTTRDIGPSIGCRCFFLKDRRQNYYLIITHEYYELDHGRLKKALKPRKKLDHAEPADILENLGVQASRITPFSCTTDRAIAKNVMVYITEKIRPSEVILCIQHPFAEGRRLVMTSGELQRYISTFKLPIGEVEEKAWPDRYNRIFTRFTDHSFKLTPASQTVIRRYELQQKIPIDSLGLAIENELQISTGEKRGNVDSETERHHASTVRISVKALWDVCKVLGKAFFINPRRDTFFGSSSGAEHEDVSSHGQTPQGSSVDPSTKSTPKESHNIIYPNPEENSVAMKEHERVVWINDTAPGEDASTNVSHGQHDSASTDWEVNQHCHKPYHDRSSDMGDTSLTVKDIFQHLRNIAVEFKYTGRSDRRYVVDELDQRLQGHMENHFLDTVTPRSGINVIQMETDAEGLPREKSSKNLHEDEKKMDDHDHDNVEVCSTAYLRDDYNHYIIIGGESDYLTKRRFRRLFHIQGPLQMDEINTPGLKTTPFSLALSLKKRKDRRSPPPNIYMILFTSLYLDPETKCVFPLDQKGSSLTITSSQLEHFISKTGIECWYIP